MSYKILIKLAFYYFNAISSTGLYVWVVTAIAGEQGAAGLSHPRAESSRVSECLSPTEDLPTDAIATGFVESRACLLRRVRGRRTCP